MDSRKPSSLELPRARSATVGSTQSGKSSKSAEEFGNKATSTKSSITTSFKSFASNLIRSKPTPAPAVATEIAPASPPRPVTPPPVQGPGPHTVRLIPSPGPNQLPWSRSAADLLEGVAVPAPAFDKVANELAEAERILDDEDNENTRVSFGFATAGYEDEGIQDVSMASDSLPPMVEQAKENRPEAPPEKPGSFVFGSPQHSVTNAQFGDAAAAVLREMNARMGVGNSSHAMSLQQLEDVMSNVGNPAAPIKTEKRSDIRFVANHDKDFAKMDSIANHYSVRSRKRKSEHTTDVGNTTTDSKLFTMPPRLSTAAADDSERTTKRARISTVDDKPTAGGKAAKDTPAVRAQLEKQRQTARASGSAVARKSGGATQQPAKSGFGLMKMVRGIWGSKDKEKAKEQTGEQPKEDKENMASDIVKRFPSVPTEDPLPSLPAAPKTRIVSGSKKSVGPRTVTPKPGPELGRSYPIAPKPRAASGLYAPTAASLARKATTSTTATRSSAATGRSRGLAAVTAPAKPVITKTTLLPSTKLPSPPATGPTASSLSRSTTGTTKVPSRPASRALPVPPTTVTRAATSGAATQGTARAISPPVRSATTAGRVTSPPNGRKSTASPGSKSPRSSIFKQPLTKDAMSMRSSAPTVQPFRLNNTPIQPLQIIKRNTISSPSKPAAAPRPPPPAAAPIRRPRISRSKVIAKLGEKRAAVGSPRGSKPRSSIQGRSLGGAKSGPGQGIDMAKARMRKSEAASRRSRVVDKSVVGRRSEGAVLRR